VALSDIAVANIKSNPHKLVLGSSKQLSFTQNPVIVDVAGPNLTNLTFLDTPGIISNGPPADIELIKQLVQKHISGTSLILLTLSMRGE
jgi:GTPase Era involved in 16S rRNA processing